MDVHRHAFGSAHRREAGEGAELHRDLPDCGRQDRRRNHVLEQVRSSATTRRRRVRPQTSEISGLCLVLLRISVRPSLRPARGRLQTGRSGDITSPFPPDRVGEYPHEHPARPDLDQRIQRAGRPFSRGSTAAGPSASTTRRFATASSRPASASRPTTSSRSPASWPSSASDALNRASPAFRMKTPRR